MPRHYLIILLIFCGLSFHSGLASASTGGDATVKATEVIALGKELYAAHCASCHRSLEKTTKARRSASRLRSSIQHFPSMAGLNFLTDQQLAAIAEALKTPAMANR